MKEDKCNLEGLLQKIATATREMELKVKQGRKITMQEVKKLSDYLSDFTIEFLYCERNFNPTPILSGVLKIALNEDNFEYPLEAKTYLYPYLVIFFSDKVGAKLDEIVENPTSLMKENNCFSLFNLAEKFLELQMIKPLKELMSKVKNIDDKIYLKLVTHLLFVLIRSIRKNEAKGQELIDNTIFLSLKELLREIVGNAVGITDETYIEELSYVISEVPVIVDNLFENWDKEQLKSITLLLLEISIEYKDVLRTYFRESELKLPEETKPQFLMIIAKICNLLYRLGYEELIPKEKIIPILGEYGYSLESFKNFYKQGIREEKSLVSPVRGGIILSSPSTKDLFKIAQDSVFLIEISGKVGDKELKRIVSGTCFIYKQMAEDDGYKLYFLTNLHNIHGIHSVLNIISKLYKNKEVDGEAKLNIFVNVDGKKCELSEVYVPPKEIYEQVLLGNPLFSRFDFAAFTVKSDKPRRYFGIKRNSKITPGESVYAFGYPEGLALSISEGMISHVYDDSNNLDKEHSQFLGTIQHTILINHGNSGGPTVKKNGELVGISTFGLRTGIGLNFSIDMRFISDCLQDRNFFKVFRVRKYVDKCLNRLQTEKALSL